MQIKWMNYVERQSALDNLEARYQSMHADLVRLQTEMTRAEQRALSARKDLARTDKRAAIVTTAVVVWVILSTIATVATLVAMTH
jgi:chromosome segregation ATPase